MRCACGYLAEHHDPVSQHCPLCQCGQQPKEHLPYTEPPAVTRDAGDGVKQHLRCREEEPQHLRRGVLREPPAVATRTWHGMQVPVIEESANAAQEDLVPRRRAQCAEEVAGAATTLGRRAVSTGYVVDAYYRELHDGAAWSILAFARHSGERGIGVWRRPAGGKWAFRSAAWGAGRVPVSAPRLKELIGEM